MYLFKIPNCSPEKVSIDNPDSFFPLLLFGVSFDASNSGGYLLWDGSNRAGFDRFRCELNTKHFNLRFGGLYLESNLEQADATLMNGQGLLDVKAGPVTLSGGYAKLEIPDETSFILDDMSFYLNDMGFEAHSYGLKLESDSGWFAKYRRIELSGDTDSGKFAVFRGKPDNMNLTVDHLSFGNSRYSSLNYLQGDLSLDVETNDGEVVGDASATIRAAYLEYELGRKYNLKLLFGGLELESDGNLFSSGAGLPVHISLRIRSIGGDMNAKYRFLFLHNVFEYNPYGKLSFTLKLGGLFPLKHDMNVNYRYTTRNFIFIKGKTYNEVYDNEFLDVPIVWGEIGAQYSFVSRRSGVRYRFGISKSVIAVLDFSHSDSSASDDSDSSGSSSDIDLDAFDIAVSGTVVTIGISY